MSEFWLLGMLLIAASGFVVAGLLQWLWNITMPDVFGLKRIAYWQAFRLLLIGALLSGSGPFLKLAF
jgi:hypothetical protein